MNLYTSVFAYVCSIGLYNGIVNTDTQNARIANADGQESPSCKNNTKNETNDETNTLHTRIVIVNPRLHRRHRQE